MALFTVLLVLCLGACAVRTIAAEWWQDRRRTPPPPRQCSHVRVVKAPYDQDAGRDA